VRLADDRSRVEIRDLGTGRAFHPATRPTIATDGGGSAVRAAMQSVGLARVREEMLDHDYKELTIPAVNGWHVMESHALHIWPRGGYMLIALPNLDGSFTVTLFLARRGANSFESLKTAADVETFFAREFPSARALMPDLAHEFFENPQGLLGTVYTDGWHIGGDILLLGDAAHAIVPFHGQGMNCAFEDCVELDRMLDASSDWAAVFARFERERKPNTDAIAAMALENYVEMRDRVDDPDFLLQRQLERVLAERHPSLFVPRYSMVSFLRVPYATAFARGQVQRQILVESTVGCRTLDQVDLAAADARVQARLQPLPAG